MSSNKQEWCRCPECDSDNVVSWASDRDWIGVECLDCGADGSVTFG